MNSNEFKILLVEDDQNTADLIKFHLKPYRGFVFNIDWADSAEKGIGKASVPGNGYHLIIMDYYLPDINGVDAVKILRARGVDTPIIFLTVANEDRIVIEALRAGAIDYFLKDDIIGPLLPIIVVNTIERENLRKQIEKDRGEQFQKIEAIQEFVITVSHEINNPLAAIKLAANILMKKEIPPEILTYVKIIKDNTERIERTILKLRELKSDQVVPYVGKLKMLDLSDLNKKSDK